MTAADTAPPRTNGTTRSAALNKLNELARFLAQTDPNFLGALYAAGQAMRPYVCAGFPRRDVFDRLQNAAEAYGFLRVHGPDLVLASLAAGLEDAVPFDARCTRKDEKLRKRQQPRAVRARAKPNGGRARTSDAHTQRKRYLISRRASEIEPRDVEFLWDGRLARGKHTCVAGKPGTGKSQLISPLLLL
jgi:hypothetical protein